jgi:hypothetical protein
MAGNLDKPGKTGRALEPQGICLANVVQLSPIFDDPSRPSWRFRFSLASLMFGMTLASVVFGTLFGSILLEGLAFVDGCLGLLALASALQFIHELRTARPSTTDAAICAALALVAVAVAVSLSAIAIPRL